MESSLLPAYIFFGWEFRFNPHGDRTRNMYQSWAEIVETYEKGGSTASSLSGGELLVPSKSDIILRHQAKAQKLLNIRASLLKSCNKSVTDEDIRDLDETIGEHLTNIKEVVSRFPDFRNLVHINLEEELNSIRSRLSCRKRLATAQNVNSDVKCDDDFTHPKKVAKPIFQHELPVKTGNKYTPLNVEDNMDVNVEEVTPKKKIQPILIKIEENFIEFIRKMSTALKTVVIVNHINGMYRFTPQSEEERVKALNYLKNNQVEFFTYTAVEEKPLKIVIKGLPNNIDIESIKENLEEKGFKPLRVAQFYSYRKKTKIPIFQVLFNRNSNSLEIFDIKEINHISVVIEKYRRRLQITYCKNCLRANHSDLNCHMKKRCSTCGDFHMENDCPVTQETLPKCEYCSNDHKVGYVCKEKREKLTRKSQKKIEEKKTNEKKIESRKSYAQAVKSKQLEVQQEKTEKNVILEELTKLAAELKETPEFIFFIRKIRENIRIFKKAENNLEKLISIFNIISEDI